MTRTCVALTLSLLVAGCSSGEGTLGDSATSPEATGTSATATGSGTGTTAGGTGTGATGGGVTSTWSSGSVSASCAPTDNALRFACTATGGGDLTWTLTEGGTVIRTLHSSGPDHAITLYGMAAGRAYTWDVTGVDGTAGGELTTGSLPAELDGVLIEASGTASVDHVLLPFGCDGSWLLVVDTAGQIRWYERMTDDTGGGPAGGISGFSLGSRDTFLAAIRGGSIVEVAMDGSVVMEATDFDKTLHHDIHHHDGRTWALSQYSYNGLEVDGFYVVDDQGDTIGEWKLSDHMEVNGTGGGRGEWSHGNAIYVDGDTALLSLRWQSAIIEVVANPDRPDFGTVNWALTGDDSDIESDFTWTDGGGFVGQHHAHWTADGKLSLFDNGDRGVDSRGLQLEVDPARMEVRESASWSLGQHCDIQGASYDLPSGGVMTTCGDGGWAGEWSASGESRWTLDLTCSSSGGPGGGGAMVPRVLPLADW